MRYKATLIYLIVAVLAAGLYFYDVQHEKKKNRMEKESKYLVKNRQMDIERFSLERNEERIVIERSVQSGVESWAITAPIKYPAEIFAVERLKKGLFDADYRRLISEKEAELNQYGLDKPSFSIIFSAAGGATGKITFGNHNPSKDGFYASTAYDSKIYLVDTSIRENIDLSLFELRDKRLFSINFDQVSKFVIEKNKEKWVFNRSKDGWLLEGESDFEVDPPKLDTIVRRFIIAQAHSFEEENAKSLKPYGLERPASIVSVSRDGVTEEILIGRPLEKDDSKVYAKMRDKPQVVTVDKWLFDDLPKKKELIEKKKDNPTKS